MLYDGSSGSVLAGWVEVTTDPISMEPILSHKTVLSQGNKAPARPLIWVG